MKHRMTRSYFGVDIGMVTDLYVPGPAEAVERFEAGESAPLDRLVKATATAEGIDYREAARLIGDQLQGKVD
jgi:hypothetical protein